MSPSYPDDSLQALVGKWWEVDPATQPSRGSLLWAFLPHVDQQPYVLEATGRVDPTEHRTAGFRIVPLQAKRPPRGSRLPVAGLPHYPNEVRTVYRAKRRPAVVISAGGPEPDKALRTGSARYQTKPTMLVAPYYGTGTGSGTGAWRAEFVDRIRRCEYPQYLWDVLPLHSSAPSILRLDQIQPLGRHGDGFELTGFRLTGDALCVIDEWLDWLLRGSLLEGGVLAVCREEFLGQSPGR